jgi:hypothetical protein
VKPVLWIPAALALALFGGCAHQHVEPVTLEGITVGENMQVFPWPREDDGPGTIFRIGSDGIRHPVLDLTGMLRISPMMMEFPTLAMKNTFGLSVIARSLQIDSFGMRDSTQDSIYVAVSGARIERAFDVPLQALVDSARRVMTWLPNNRYFLITETVLADSVRYLLSHTALADLGGQARLAAIARGSSNVAWESDGRLELAIRFQKPLHVFYKVEGLTPRGAALGGAPFAVDRTPVNGRITWVSDGTRR